MALGRCGRHYCANRVRSMRFQNLLTFSQAWGNHVSDAKRLVFAPTLRNQLKAANTFRLTRNLGHNSTHNLVRVLRQIEAAISSGSAEAAFVRRHYSVPAQALESRLHVDPYETAAIQNEIGALVGKYDEPAHLTNLGDELTHLVDSDQDNQNAIKELTSVLVARLLELTSANYLESLATKSFSDAYFECFSDDVKAGIASDVEARDAFTEVVHVINEAVASQLADMGVLHDRLAQYLDLSFASNSPMKTHAVFFLEKLLDNATLPEDAVEALTSFRYTGDPAPESLLPLVQLESIQTWRDDAWQTYKHMVIWLMIWQLTQYFIQPRFLTGRSATPVDGRMDQAWSSYNSCILSHFTPHVQGWEASSRSGAVLNRFPWAFGQAVADHLGPCMQSQELASHWDRFLCFMLGRIASYLQDRVAAENPVTQLTQVEYREVLRRWKTKRDALAMLQGVATEIAAILLDAGELVPNTDAVVEAIGPALYDRLLCGIKSDLGKDTLDHLIPDAVDGTLIRSGFQGLVSPFVQPSPRFKVITIVGGLDCAQQTTRLGEVVIYDARIWDEGEYGLLDMFNPPDFPGHTENYGHIPRTGTTFLEGWGLSSAWGLGVNPEGEYVRHSARACVSVEAFDPQSAAEKARAKIAGTLSIMSYQVGSPRTGSALQLSPHSVCISEDGRTVHAVLPKRITPHEEVLAHSEGSRCDMLKCAESYAPLLAVPPVRQTDIHARLLTAYYWYHRGVWEDNPVERFMDFWIGLEQLLLREYEPQAAELPDRLASILATWGESSHGRAILRAWNELTEAIERRPSLVSKLDAESECNGWRDDAHILLGNPQEIASHIGDNWLETQLLSLLQGVDSGRLRMQREDLHERVLLKALLLLRRRNDIAHSGVSFTPDMCFYAEEVGECVRTAILKIAIVVVPRPGQCDTIVEVVEQWKRPWGL